MTRDSIPEDSALKRTDSPQKSRVTFKEEPEIPEDGHSQKRSSHHGPNPGHSNGESLAGPSHPSPSHLATSRDSKGESLAGTSQHNPSHNKSPIHKDGKHGTLGSPSRLNPNHHAITKDGKDGTLGGPKTHPKRSERDKRGKGTGGISFSLPNSFKESAEETSSSPSRPEGFEPWEVDPALLTIGSLVGFGTYAKVYKGTYKGETVAIKLLEWGDQASHFNNELSSLRYQFYKEVEILHRLKGHPNVCKILGASLGSTHFSLPSPNGQSLQVSKMMCCIVMEFLEGGTLRQFWIKNRKIGKRRMPYSVVIQFALDIARGLEFLHSKDICHRDLKPDNIIMDKYYVLKIADFGVSRVAPKDDDDAMTSHVGTPNYCAPEILSGSPYNLKSDIYSYGVCIWEIYTCNFPYPEMNDMYNGPTNKRIIDNDYRPHIPNCCPKELKRIMAECWVKNPRARPEMTQVVDWLQEINTSKTTFCTNGTVVESCACVSDGISTAC